MKRIAQGVRAVRSLARAWDSPKTSLRDDAGAEADAARPSQSPDAEKTADAAVRALQAELNLVNSNNDAIDRKALLLPTFLVALAGFLIGPPGSQYNLVQVVYLALAIATGGAAIILALRTLRAGQISVGPDADTMAENTHLPVVDFNRAVAASLAEAINQQTVASLNKSRPLNRALYLAAATMLILVLVRVTGGVSLSQPNQPTSPPASSPAATPGPSASPATTPQPSAAPVAPPPSPVGQPPVGNVPVPDFGQQWMTKGGSVPADIETRIIRKDLPRP